MTPHSPLILDVDFQLRREHFNLEARLHVEAGEVLAILGPNGSGKSTLIRAIAGLEPISRGHITIAGTVVAQVDPAVFIETRKRNISVVFQDYALFPHLTVAENISFGIKGRGASRKEVRERVHNVLDNFDLTDLAHRRPAQLSGGQSQRVALARAMATQPDVLLLDEPMAALDAVNVAEMRSRLDHYLEGFAGATILVTHDPLDALILADRIAILENGGFTHVGTPGEISQFPRTQYSATLMGSTFITGVAHAGVVKTDLGSEIVTNTPALTGTAAAVIRPESVVIHLCEPEGSSRNSWKGVISDIHQVVDRVLLHIDGEVPLVAAITPSSLSALKLQRGTEVWTSVKAMEVTGVSLN